MDTDSGRSVRTVGHLVDILASIDVRQGVRPTLHRVADTVREATGADRCAVLVVDGDHLVPSVVSLRRPRERVERAFGEQQPIALDDLPDVASVFDDRAVTPLAPSTAVLLPAGWADLLGLAVSLGAPVLDRGEPLALLVVGCVEERLFAADDVAFLEAAAETVRVALLVSSLASRADTAETKHRGLLAGLEEALSTTDVIDSMQTFVDVVSLAIDRSVAMTFTMEGAPCMLSSGPRSDRVTTFPFVAGGLDGPGGLQVYGDPVDGDDLELCVVTSRLAACVLERARLREETIRRAHLAEVLDHVPQLLDTATTFPDVLTRLNREVGRRASLACLEVAFRTVRMVDATGTRRTNAAEVALLRRSGQDHVIEPAGEGRVLVTVPVDRRNVGVLTAQLGRGLSEPTTEQRSLLRTMARAIGDLAARTVLHLDLRDVERRLEVSEARERLTDHLDRTLGGTLRGLWTSLRDLSAAVPADDAALVSHVGDLRDLAARGLLQAHLVGASLSLLNLRREGGLIPALRALLGAFEDATGIGTTLRVEGEERPLASEIEEAVYLVAFEVVSLEAPGKATAVVVRVEFASDEVVLGIRDDGIDLGLRSAYAEGRSVHQGLRLMHEHLAPVGGTLRVAPARPRGVRVEAWFPLDRPRNPPANRPLLGL